MSNEVPVQNPMMASVRTETPASWCVVLLFVLSGTACAQQSESNAAGSRHGIQGMDDAFALVIDERVVALEGPFGQADLPVSAASPSPLALFGGYVDLDEDGARDPYLLANPGTPNVQVHYWRANPSGNARYLGEFPSLKQSDGTWRAVERTSATSYVRRDYAWTETTLELAEQESVGLDLTTGEWHSTLIIRDAAPASATLTEEEAIARIEAW